MKEYKVTVDLSYEEVDAINHSLQIASATRAASSIRGHIWTAGMKWHEVMKGVADQYIKYAKDEQTKQSSKDSK